MLVSCVVVSGLFHLASFHSFFKATSLFLQFVYECVRSLKVVFVVKVIYINKWLELNERSMPNDNKHIYTIPD